MQVAYNRLKRHVTEFHSDDMPIKSINDESLGSVKFER